MLYTTVPAGVMRRTSPCDLDIISEMSGNWFALLLVNGWVYVPAPKVLMRNHGKMQRFLPEHPNVPQSQFRARKPFLSIFVRAGFFSILRVTARRRCPKPMRLGSSSQYKKELGIDDIFVSSSATQRVSPIEMESVTIRAEPNRSKVGESFAERKVLGVLWFQTVAY